MFVIFLLMVRQKTFNHWSLEASMVCGCCISVMPFWQVLLIFVFLGHGVNCSITGVYFFGEFPPQGKRALCDFVDAYENLRCVMDNALLWDNEIQFDVVCVVFLRQSGVELPCRSSSLERSKCSYHDYRELWYQWMGNDADELTLQDAKCLAQICIHRHLKSEKDALLVNVHVKSNGRYNVDDGTLKYFELEKKKFCSTPHWIKSLLSSLHPGKCVVGDATLRKSHICHLEISDHILYPTTATTKYKPFENEFFF